MQSNPAMMPYYLGILLLAIGLTVSLSRDLGRAFRWFLRTLVRVGTGLIIIALCYAALYNMSR